MGDKDGLRLGDSVGLQMETKFDEEEPANKQHCDIVYFKTSYDNVGLTEGENCELIKKKKLNVVVSRLLLNPQYRAKDLPRETSLERKWDF